MLAVLSVHPSEGAPMTLRDVNWRKGCFRLWLFLSVLWIVTVGTLFLYPATSKYLEAVKATNELQSLRANICYKLGSDFYTDEEMTAWLAHHPDPNDIVIDSAQPKSKVKLDVPDPWKTEAQPAKGDVFDEVSKESLMKVQETQTGVTVAFLWFETQPPVQTDLDEVFGVALGLPPSKSPPVIIPPSPPGFIWDPWTVVPEGVSGEILSKRAQKLSGDESILASKLQRLRELKKVLESRPNWEKNFLLFLGMAFLPPFALLIFGVGLLWSLSGFAPERRK